MHVIGAFVAGGAERFVVSLIQRMKFDGADPSLCVLSSRCDAVGLEMRAMLTAARIHVEVGPSARVGWGTLKWYARMLSKWRPDIVHLHTPNTEMIQYLSGFIFTENSYILATCCLEQFINKFAGRLASAPRLPTQL